VRFEIHRLTETFAEIPELERPELERDDEMLIAKSDLFPIGNGEPLDVIQ